MLSHMRLKRLSLACIGAICIASPNSAIAAVQCPTISAGHPLRLLGGGSLYLGRVQDNMRSAPDSTQPGPNGAVNTWLFRNAEDYTLICSYEGTQAVVALPLTPDIKVCRQEPRTRSFVCQ